MSSPKPLFVNQRISVSKAGSKEWYISQIQDLDRNSVYIALPYSHLVPMILQPNERVSVFFAGEGAGYRFDSIVTGIKKDQVLLYIIRRPVTFTRVQLRNFVRLPVCLDVEYAICEGNEIPEELTPISTRDISAGGMQLVTKTPLQQGDNIYLSFVLKHSNKSMEFNAHGQVVRVNSEHDDANIYLAGIKFINLNMGVQDKITGYVFAKMVERNSLK